MKVFKSRSEKPASGNFVGKTAGDHQGRDQRRDAKPCRMLSDGVIIMLSNRPPLVHQKIGRSRPKRRAGLIKLSGLSSQNKAEPAARIPKLCGTR